MFNFCYKYKYSFCYNKKSTCLLEHKKILLPAGRINDALQERRMMKNIGLSVLKISV